jgi:Ca2+-binding RTX toxin-like protein
VFFLAEKCNAGFSRNPFPPHLPTFPPGRGNSALGGGDTLSGGDGHETVFGGVGGDSVLRLLGPIRQQPSVQVFCRDLENREVQIPLFSGLTAGSGET